MDFCTRNPLRWLVLLFLLSRLLPAHAADNARFDLVGPSIDIRVTRGADTLPIASVPNLQPGDKLWLHPDLPATQSVHYLLVCVFLRGTTNPPPNDWFIRIETWNKSVRQEGVFVTVPTEAQQAVLFMAPETGGDFSTLRSAVQGRPGIFVRASQDLAEAGFEQARIEKYLASIRRVPPSDSAALQQHSDLLARTLALKPNADCFKRTVDTQFTCLTQTGTQTLLDDGHGQSIVSMISTGQNSDLIQAASYTGLGGAGVYSAYVGAIVDLVRVMGNLHTAKYQYIPAISFPQGEALNLRLNTPPSFHNPKSVLVIGLPAVQAATPPPLRSADAAHIACLLQPNVVLPIEGAPLVFSADFAHSLVLHLNRPSGAPAQPDIPLIPDAYLGGLLLQRTPPHRVELRDAKPLAKITATAPAPTPTPAATQPQPTQLTATIQGRWGFDAFTGPTVTLQQLPGKRWQIAQLDNVPPPFLVAGHKSQLFLTSSGSACIHTISARPAGAAADIDLPFKVSTRAADPNLLELTMPTIGAANPGDLRLSIQQFAQPAPDEVSARVFSEPARIDSIRLHAGDRTATITGSNLAEIASLTIGDLVFTPSPDAATGGNTLRLSLPADSLAPPTHTDDRLSASVILRDGRSLGARVLVAAPRPAMTLLSKSSEPAHDSPDAPSASPISLASPDDIALNQRLTFTLKTPAAFPRNGQVEIETLDTTLRTVLTLAPSGGLLLQDPHTIVATLDPLRSFGPSAFGQLHLRVVFPATEASTTAPSSDWLPLGTLVRLPALTQLQCPADTALSQNGKALPCTLLGTNLFLIAAISTDPAFADPTPVPDGYTGSTLTIPHPTAATVFLRLRDDPTPINPAVIPEPAPTPTPARPSTPPHPRKPPASR